MKQPLRNPFMGTIVLAAAAFLQLGAAPAADPETVVISVPGMHCTGCANSIREEFNKRSEVTSSRFDFKAKSVTLRTTGKGELTDEEIREVLTKLGYAESSIARK